MQSGFDYHCHGMSEDCSLTWPDHFTGAGPYRCTYMGTYTDLCVCVCASVCVHTSTLNLSLVHKNK